MDTPIFLTRAYLPDMMEYIDEIKELWETHWITSMGKKHNEFEKALEEYLEAPNVSVFTNGHNALELTIKAMGLKGEVITTPYTFVSTIHAIVRNGLHPVFCDIKEDDFTIDTEQIEKYITENTSAIIAVHVYGNPCDVVKIDSIAQKYNLKVIYDAAHAFGERYNDKNIATYGDASIFSFHASKVFNSIEGGCAVYSDIDLKDKFYKLRNFGIAGQDVEYIGTNAKMNEFVAAMGLCNLRHIDEVINQRKKNVEHYIKCLKKIDGIHLMIDTNEDNIRKNYAYFPILVKGELKDRDKLCEILNSKGIQALRNFFPIITKNSCYREYYDEFNTPVAEKLSERILLLPLYAELKFEQIEYICISIAEYFKQK